MVKLLTLLMLFVPKIVFALDLDSQRISIENMLRDQLESQLRQFLPEESFSVSADVDVYLEDVRRISEQEKIKDEKNPGGSDEKVAKNLPGFSSNRQKADKQAAGSTLSSERIRFDQMVTVRKVRISLILEKDLSEDKRKVAKDIVRQKIQTAYGSKGQIVISEVDLTNKIESNSGKNAIEFLKHNGDLFLLLFMFLSVLGLVLLIFRKQLLPISKDLDLRSQEKLSDDNSKNAEGEKKSVSNVDDNLLQKLFNQMDQNPITTRNFLQALDHKSKGVVIMSAKSPALKQSIARFMGVDEKKFQDENFDQELFQNLVYDLGKYNSMQSLTMNQRFGYLSFLGGAEILELLSNDDPKEIGTIIPYLPEDKQAKIIRSLDAKTKAGIIKAIQEGKALLSPDRVNELDDRLRRQFYKLGIKVIVDGSNKGKSVENILNFDPNANEVISILKADAEFKFSESLQKYDMDFEKILKIERSFLERIISSLDNEVIAACLKNIDGSIRQNILGSFGEMRQQIIHGLLNKEFDKEDIKEAQYQIIRRYREMT